MADTGSAPVTGGTRWGFVGLGRIAENVATELVSVVEGGELYAVASRSLPRAQAFAARHGSERAYGSYRQLLADDLVDAVYIATPHPQHHAIALAAIDAGKAVLVEKAFTATVAGTVEVVATARAAGVFVMEAMWTRFQPAVTALRQFLAGGELGEVRSVIAELGLARPFDPSDRLWDPAQGGGAMLDLAVYPVSFAQLVFGGRPSSVQVTGSLAENGVDAESSILLGFGDGHAVASSSLLSRLPGAAHINLTAGRIHVPPRFHHPDRFVVYGLDGVDESPGREVVVAANGRGYSHELVEVQRCLAAGLTESPVMPLDDTVAVMEILEAALGMLGVTMAEDPAALA